MCVCLQLPNQKLVLLIMDNVIILTLLTTHCRRTTRSCCREHLVCLTHAASTLSWLAVCLIVFSGYDALLFSMDCSNGFMISMLQVQLFRVHKNNHNWDLRLYGLFCIYATIPVLQNDSGQVVRTDLPQSPIGITWYRQWNCDDLRPGR